MKKSSILGVACALMIGQSAVAQNTTTAVTFEESPAITGYSFNQFKDNWFIQAEGGANMLFSHRDDQRKLTDRFAPAASLWIGKWFSPILGVRVGANFMMNKGISDVEYGYGVLLDDYRPNGYWKTKVNELGPQFNVMLNLTNWWCGYRPGRVYNATAYVGGSAYWSFVKKYGKNDVSDGYHLGDDRTIALNAGLLNTFAVSDHVNITLDIRYTMLAAHQDEATTHRCCHDLAAYLGVAYNFGKSYWTAPVVPVVETVQDCEVVETKLQATKARVADLERELRDCLDNPVKQEVVAEGPLATIYYPINVSRLTNVDRKVLGAIAEVMKADTNQKYTLTGWADNYTGTDQFNDRLRHARVDGVANYLTTQGVSADQLNVTVNNGNLYNGGEKFVSLDRAVTIEKAK